MSTPAPPRLVVTIVHGTFPRGMWAQLRRDCRARWARWRGRNVDEALLWGARDDKHDPLWFDASSAFETGIVGPLRERGDVVEVRRFRWSGRNTFSDRAEAATRLRRELAATCDAFPGVPHAVVAHSHGGTVSVDALDTTAGDATLPVALLMTLGTPFVQLANRAARFETAMQNWQGPVGAVMPGAVLALGVFSAVAYLLRRDGWHDVVAGLFLLVVARAAVTWRFGDAVLVVLGVLLLGGADARSDVAALAVLSVFVGIASLALAAAPPVRVSPLVRWKPRHLRCRLVALRAPGDEATLAIVGAQAMEKTTLAVVSAIGTALRPLTWIGSGSSAESAHASTSLARMIQAVRGITRALIVGLLAGSVIFGVAWIAGLPVPGVLHWPTGTPWMRVGIVTAQAVAVSFAGLLGIIAFSCALLFALPIGLVTTYWAIGPECFWLPLVTRVDAEPLPDADAESRTRMTLEVLYDAAVVGLAHSMYNAPEVRARVRDELERLLAADSVAQPPASTQTRV